MTEAIRRDESAIEGMIREKGLTAPRVTPAQIDALMHGVTVQTYVFPGTTTTVAAAFLANGFCLATATSNCAAPENFNAEIGVKLAIEKVMPLARDKAWEVEGYALKKELSK